MSDEIKICKNCGKEKKKNKTFDVWYHLDSGMMICFPYIIAEPNLI